ncbi:MAG: nucleoside-diphosphate kinase [Candidatus Eremiobacteraeota bacterium]|nr:nucleoside-diphosphate kinase [Candidatus Eremiobacteraeota bacterium]MBV8354325.1 nucleoside-diphosphate kinase [Candidatus Eremiobacteraeota bacterium]
MALEQTLILCKTDAVERGLVGEILARCERRGYVIVGMKMLRCEEARAKRHYAEHEGKPFFQGLVEYIMSGPILAFVVQGDRAIDGWRQMIGATDPAKAAPGTIRADFAQTIGRNLVHGSDSPESAKREIGIWFDPDELFPRGHPLAGQLQSE